MPAQPGVRLSALGTSQAIPCRAENISEGGLFVILPAEARLRVGERCEVTFTGAPGLPDRVPFATLNGLTCYATVVRTVNRSVDAAPYVGAGLRFDHPLFF